MIGDEKCSLPLCAYVVGFGKSSHISSLQLSLVIRSLPLINPSLLYALNCRGLYVTRINTYVTGFMKTIPIGTRNEIQFIADY